MPVARSEVSRMAMSNIGVGVSSVEDRARAYGVESLALSCPLEVETGPGPSLAISHQETHPRAFPLSPLPWSRADFSSKLAVQTTHAAGRRPCWLAHLGHHDTHPVFFSTLLSFLQTLASPQCIQ